MQTDSTTTWQPPGRSRLLAALVLQGLPLLAATSCLVRGIEGEAAQQTWFQEIRWLVVASALSWGLGYLPLRRWGRAGLALLVGAVGTILAANTALSIWSVAPDGEGETALRRAVLVWGSLMLVAIGLLMADIWRLAYRPLPSAPRLFSRRAVSESQRASQH